MIEQAIVISDTVGVIQWWNSGAERLFGYPAAEAIGRTLDLIVPERLRDRHWAGFRHAMEAGFSKIDGQAVELPVKCRDGTVASFPARFVFLRDPGGKPAGAVAIYTPRQESDVT